MRPRGVRKHAFQAAASSPRKQPTVGSTSSGWGCLLRGQPEGWVVLSDEERGTGNTVILSQVIARSVY